MAFPLANPPSRLSPKLLTRATTAPLASPSPNYDPRIKEFPPNALRRKIDRLWRGGFSLGVDLGLSRTGVALSKGFSVRPLTVIGQPALALSIPSLVFNYQCGAEKQLTIPVLGFQVLELRGQKLELRLLEIAEDEEADEFIIGVPRSSDGRETTQSNKVHSVAGRLAVRAAERGLNKTARQRRIDAYAAMMVLERYFSLSGEAAELVLPKDSDLQERLRRGPPRDIDFFSE
ncbi:hypothetical protein CDL15_Pgr023891 [Punica granatum]|uniref:YqgF/RNase H-like domain-containing protein n=1 Tax=Punica granatum TaxID=22663 RepID=A0A218XV57_PUNGR|nr:hypothetical protein CDL15_Pgr023891 [Punica granatum]PKI52624.1 hypothetical protein CRG98_026964 [Punica granatum]